MTAFVAPLPLCAAGRSAPRVPVAFGPRRVAKRPFSSSSSAARSGWPVLAARAIADLGGLGGAGGPGAGGGKGDDDFLERIRSINRVDDTAPSDDNVSLLVSIIEQDGNAQVRYAALSRLSNLNAVAPSVQAQLPAVLNAARKALTSDSEPSCRSAAADLIAGLRLNDGFQDLVDAFNETSDWVLKFSIAAGVGEMKHPQSYDFLSSVLAIKIDEWKNPTPSPSPSSTPTASSTSTTIDPEQPTEMDDTLLIAACVGALGDLGDTRAVPIVKEFLEHPDSSISERAKFACDLLEKS